MNIELGKVVDVCFHMSARFKHTVDRKAIVWLTNLCIPRDYGWQHKKWQYMQGKSEQATTTTEHTQNKSLEVLSNLKLCTWQYVRSSEVEQVCYVSRSGWLTGFFFPLSRSLPSALSSSKQWKQLCQPNSLALFFIHVYCL